MWRILRQIAAQGMGTGVALPGLMPAPCSDSRPRLAARLLALLLVAACGLDGASRDAPGAAPSPVVDLADPIPGVPARGYEPAVVSLDVGGAPRCAGALVASDVVVTARHCVSALRAAVLCPDAGSGVAGPLGPGAIAVRVGDDLATASERAHARAVVAPARDDLCDADVAFVLLDEAIDDVAPLAVHATGAASGDRVRTVEFERLVAAERAPRAEPPIKVLRDHVPVLGTSALELWLREPAGDAAGGPALDEASGDIVGVATRAETSGPVRGVVYARLDAFLPALGAALAESAFGIPSRAAHLLRAHKGPADLGATCVRGADCAAGACVEVDSARYCSRTCGPRDRCPPRYRCEPARTPSRTESVCIKT